MHHIEWRETNDEGVADLYVDGRIVEYDVAEMDRADALHRARIYDVEVDDDDG